VEPSASEEEKLGPTKALSIIMRGAVPDDYLIAAGDNLFSLDLVKMAAFFKTVRSPVVALYNVSSKELAKKVCMRQHRQLLEDHRVRGEAGVPQVPACLDWNLRASVVEHI